MSEQPGMGWNGLGAQGAGCSLNLREIYRIISDEELNLLITIYSDDNLDCYKFSSFWLLSDCNLQAIFAALKVAIGNTFSNGYLRNVLAPVRFWVNRVQSRTALKEYPTSRAIWVSQVKDQPLSHPHSPKPLTKKDEPTAVINHHNQTLFIVNHH